MLLDVKPFFSSYDTKKEFSYSLDLSSMIQDDGISIITPVLVSGYLQAKRGAVTAHWHISADLHLRCDRCLSEFVQPFSKDYTHRLFYTWKQGQDDDAILLNQDCLDLDSAVLDDILVSLPMKILCKETCKGICPVCGVNRNDAECHCEEE